MSIFILVVIVAFIWCAGSFALALFVGPLLAMCERRDRERLNR